MKIHPQIIKKAGSPIFVVLPYNEFKDILKLLQDIEDVQAVPEVENDRNERFPFELAQQIAAGKNAIKTFREYRNLSQADLARQIGVSRQYINQLENNERNGAMKILKSIAATLSVDIDTILPDV